MESYAIGIIIQNTDSLLKIKSFFDKIKTLIDVQKIEIEPTNFSEKTVLLANSNAEINFFVGISSDMSQNKRNSLFINNDGIGDYYLPNMYSLEFRGQIYLYTEMEQRLKTFIGEQWKGNYVIINLKSDLNSLLTQFKKY